MAWCSAVQDELQDKTVQRITFKEVTQKAVEVALASPRQIDSHLVDAYLARRALDYLMCYSISPTLMRKVGAAKSAGTYPYFQNLLFLDHVPPCMLPVTQQRPLLMVKHLQYTCF